jgi:hypothetical protein
VLLLGLKLGLAVPRDAGDGSAHGARDAVREAGAQVVELALGFLGLAAGVLFAALLFEVLAGVSYTTMARLLQGGTNLRAYEAANELLSGPDGLVP